MIATIFHEGKNNYPDMITAQGDTLEELRDNSLKAVKQRGWDESECWSQVYGTDEEIKSC